MSDSGTEPSITRSGPGFELMFIFTLPALMIVGSIAEMAATGYWWLMGVAFVGALIATGLVAVTIFHYTSDEEQMSTTGSFKQSGAERDSSTRQPRQRRHHRLALHH